MWTNILLLFLSKQSSYRTSKCYVIEDTSETSLVTLLPDEREELGTNKKRMRGEGGKGEIDKFEKVDKHIPEEFYFINRMYFIMFQVK